MPQPASSHAAARRLLPLHDGASLLAVVIALAAC